MIFKFSRKHKSPIPIFIAAAILMAIHGCNSTDYSREMPSVSKSITAISINEEDNAWNCIIKGNRPLTFSAINQVSPAGILLYFPETTLRLQAQTSVSEVAAIINHIDAGEFIDGEAKNARVRIGLNMDRPYSISPGENAVTISFPKTLAQPAADKSETAAVESNTAGYFEPGIPPATLLLSVAATSLENHILIKVHADGAIMEYRSFTIENPARIVFDINDLKGVDSGGKTIGVSSKWIKQIRYSSYPDKIRLVLDMEDQSESQYFSFPTDSGMLIYVGQLPEPLNDMDYRK